MNSIEKFLLNNPFKRGMAELGLIVFSGIIGMVAGWSFITGSILVRVVGSLLVVWGFYFHTGCEKYHKEAHKDSDQIAGVVQEGPYSKIRHPLYVGLIAVNIGFALAFDQIVTLWLALLSIVHWSMTALSEEKALKDSLGDSYLKYMEKIKWRFLPGIF